VILRRHDHPYVRHSEPFKNGEQLLAECRQRGLEGIVSKRKHSPYKSAKGIRNARTNSSHRSADLLARAVST
jgi:ATP-dependent DNA ligase